MVYRFEPFQLDESTRELVRDGQVVAVEPKVFDLLRLLVRHRRRALSRDLLLRELWPGVVVGESSLFRLVKEARRALGDDGETQRWIRTVRGLGYRFCGPVAAGSPESSRDEAERLIAHARLALEAAVDRGARDLRAQLDDFVRTCQIAIEAVHD